MCTRLFLAPNIEVDVTTRPRSDVTAQVDLDTETVHGHWKTTADRDRRTCGATTQQKRWHGLAVHSPVSSLHAHVRSLSTACGHSQGSGAPPSRLAHAAESSSSSPGLWGLTLHIHPAVSKKSQRRRSRAPQTCDELVTIFVEHGDAKAKIKFPSTRLLEQLTYTLAKFLLSLS